MNDRQFNSPSPVIFPSASPTPKLYSMPSKKLPDSNVWQEIGVDSVPQMVHFPHERHTHISSLPTDIEDQEDFLSSIVSTQSSYSLASRSVSLASSQPNPIEDSVAERNSLLKKTTKLGSFISRVKKVASGKSFH